MKRKQLIKVASLVFGAVALTACYSDNPDNPNVNTDEGDGVYVSFALTNSGNGSRSATTTDGESDAGNEVGTNAENTVSTIQLFLLDENNTAKATCYLSAADVANTELETADYITYTAKFRNADLEDLAGQTVKVYVYCNSDQIDLADFDLDKAYDITTTTPWTDYRFQMTSAADYTFTIPADLSAYDKGNPLNLCESNGSTTPINVKRTTARIDYGQAMENDTYTLEDGVTITLTDMALINMSNGWYALQRVAANATHDPVILGSETASNYVVDTDWTFKTGWTSSTGNTSNFQYPLGTTRTAYDAYDWISIKDVVSGKADNDKTWNTDGSASTIDYYAWRYVTENTIPGDADNKGTYQVNGISTGVVFRGQLTATNEVIAAAMSDKEDLYVYNNTLYGTWDDVAKNATDSNPLLLVAYQNSIDADDQVVASKAVAEGFTIIHYDEELEGYFLNYYYWNRHNDNADAYTMGTMEFATVRNNVYKLAVTSIMRYGHPTPGDDGDDPTDPDPVDPDDPDEDENIYFQVALQVKPWVVRVNNITF